MIHSARYTNLKTSDGLRTEIVVDESGFIAAEPAARAEEIDCGGRIVTTPFADPHVHLDKTFSTTRNPSGTLREAIAVWRDYKASLDKADYLRRGAMALERAYRHGIRAMRTHVDVSPKTLVPMEAILELREQWRERIAIQIVALGSPGISRAETNAVRAAMSIGADGVGGCPALVDEPEALISAALQLAEEKGQFVDLHVDETTDPEMLILELLSERARQHDGVCITAGHCCSLAFCEEERFRAIAEKVANSQISIVTLPSCNLVLQGRSMRPAPRAVTPVKELLAMGVSVAAGSDNVRDPFNPFGDYNPLMTANILAHAAHLTGDEELGIALEMVGNRAMKVMNQKPWSLRPGHRAHFLIHDCTDPHELLAAIPPLWRAIG